MKIKAVLLISLLLTGCGSTTHNPDDDSLVDEAQTLNISNISIFKEDGQMHVYYDKSINPFKYENHTYSFIKINGKTPSFVSYSSYLHTQGYFDTTPIDKNLSSYSFEWYDTKNVKYLVGECNNITQYTPKITYPSGYTSLIFQDEFLGNEVDNTKWGYNLGNGNKGWGNGEAEYYTSENASVKDGLLHITAKKEEMEGFSYTSARLLTKEHFSFKYGYVEARIALPEIEGMWPAFWMLSEENYYGTWPKSGEIDIMEAKGRIPGTVSSALHFTTTGGNNTYKSHEYNFTDNYTISTFHTYACEWKEDSISFYVDDVKHLTISNSQWQTITDLENQNAPFDRNFHLILNLAVGGHFDNDILPPDSFTSADMLVDYVRIFN